MDLRCFLKLLLRRLLGHGITTRRAWLRGECSCRKVAPTERFYSQRAFGKSRNPFLVSFICNCSGLRYSVDVVMALDMLLRRENQWFWSHNFSTSRSHKHEYSCCNKYPSDGKNLCSSVSGKVVGQHGCFFTQHRFMDFWRCNNRLEILYTISVGFCIMDILLSCFNILHDQCRLYDYKFLDDELCMSKMCFQVDFSTWYFIFQVRYRFWMYLVHVLTGPETRFRGYPTTNSCVHMYVCSYDVKTLKYVNHKNTLNHENFMIRTTK